MASWPSSGWNDGRTTGQMLEFLSASGEIAISRREGNERIWDLAHRVHPPNQPEITIEEAMRIRAERRLRSLGIARPAALGRNYTVADYMGTTTAAPPRAIDGIGVPVEVEGVAGKWVADPQLLRRQFEGRTATLSPFDRLIHDRRRLLDLFGFDYVLEIYVPPAKRRWGYYVLPVLDGDRFIGRFDAKADRESSTLRVPAIHMERSTTAKDVKTVEGQLQELAGWLGLDKVVIKRRVSAGPRVSGRIRCSRPGELCRWGGPAARNPGTAQEAAHRLALARRGLRAGPTLPGGRGQPDHRAKTLGFRHPPPLPRGRGTHAEAQLRLLANRECAQHRPRPGGMGISRCVRK